MNNGDPADIPQIFSCVLCVRQELRKVYVEELLCEDKRGEIWCLKSSCSAQRCVHFDTISSRSQIEALFPGLCLKCKWKTYEHDDHHSWYTLDYHKTLHIRPDTYISMPVDAYTAAGISCTWQRSLKFRHSFYRYAKYIHTKIRNASIKNPLCDIQCSAKVIIYLDIYPSKFKLDYAWCWRMCGWVTKTMLLEDAMSWLNTLGGGYSALGDYFEHHAETAGRISARQLKIGLEMGDPGTVARCYLYYALSLMQRGNLKFSKYIIRYQYKVAKVQLSFDHRLLAMCQGMWSRLRYLYHCRKIHSGALQNGQTKAIS